jgi:serine protease Do
MAMGIAKQLVERGSVVHRALPPGPFLGVTLDSKFDAATATKLGLSKLEGCRITAVTPRSPAEAAKLQIDDVVVEFDGTPIENDVHLVTLVSLSDVGKEVPIVVFRGRKMVKLSVKIADRSTFEAPN